MTDLKAIAPGIAAALAATLAATVAFGHGDMTPQAVDTRGLPAFGEDWLAENPFRSAEGDLRETALEVGAQGYNSNCARCHGLEVISGGLAPDLRYLEPSDWGDEWYVERFRRGYIQNGTTKMPSFDGLLSQEAAWAIRTYIETRPDLDQLDAIAGERQALIDRLSASVGDAGALGAIADDLLALSASVDTAYGEGEADTPMTRAAALLKARPDAAEKALAVLADGLD
ncbi:MAG: cytochrome c-550 PedF [Pseudomonadota bacterium]